MILSLITSFSFFILKGFLISLITFLFIFIILSAVMLSSLFLSFESKREFFTNKFTSAFVLEHHNLKFHMEHSCREQLFFSVKWELHKVLFPIEVTNYKRIIHLPDWISKKSFYDFLSFFFEWRNFDFNKRKPSKVYTIVFLKHDNVNWFKFYLSKRFFLLNLGNSFLNLHPYPAVYVIVLFWGHSCF